MNKINLEKLNELVKAEEAEYEKKIEQLAEENKKLKKENKELLSKYVQSQKQYDAVVEQDKSLQREIRQKNKRLARINEIVKKLNSNEYNYSCETEVELDLNEITKLSEV